MLRAFEYLSELGRKLIGFITCLEAGIQQLVSILNSRRLNLSSSTPGPVQEARQKIDRTTATSVRMNSAEYPD
jgi:hypothetical protein